MKKAFIALLSLIIIGTAASAQTKANTPATNNPAAKQASAKTATVSPAPKPQADAKPKPKPKPDPTTPLGHPHGKPILE